MLHSQCNTLSAIHLVALNCAKHLLRGCYRSADKCQNMPDPFMLTPILCT